MEQKVSVWKSAMTYGLYFAIASILVSVVFYVTGNPFSKGAQFASYGVMIVGVVLIQLAYRKALGGSMTYGQGLVIALLSFLFASIIMAIYTILLYEVIDPGLKEQLRLFTEQKMVEQGKLSQEQIDAALTMTQKFQTPVFMAISSLFSYTFLGLIIGLITSIFIQKKPKEDFSA